MTLKTFIGVKAKVQLLHRLHGMARTQHLQKKLTTQNIKMQLIQLFENYSNIRHDGCHATLNAKLSSYLLSNQISNIAQNE